MLQVKKVWVQDICMVLAELDNSIEHFWGFRDTPKCSWPLGCPNFDQSCELSSTANYNFYMKIRTGYRPTGVGTRDAMASKNKFRYSLAIPRPNIFFLGLVFVWNSLCLFCRSSFQLQDSHQLKMFSLAILRDIIAKVWWRLPGMKFKAT